MYTIGIHEKYSQLEDDIHENTKDFNNSISAIILESTLIVSGKASKEDSAKRCTATNDLT